MKKNILLTFIFFCMLRPLFSSDSEIPNNYLSRFSRLLNQYEKFMLNNGNKNSDYYKAFELFTEKLKSNDTHFSLDINNQNLINGGAKFEITDNNNSYFISVGYKLVDIYDFYPTLIYSILTHEIWHAYAYITNPQGFLIQETDPFERLLYEFDAIYYEAQFIYDSVINSDFILTNFEEYLHLCYSENVMDDFISAQLKIDYFSLNSLYQLRNEYYEQRNKERLDIGLREFGENLLKYYQESLTENNEWFTYKILVALKTYYNYTIILFKQTEGNENPEQTWEEIYEIYDGYFSVYTKISEVLENKEDYITEQHTKYLDHFNQDLFY